MIRLSALRNRPVILGNRRLGFVQDVELDEDYRQGTALIVSCGLRGKRLVPAEDIRMIAEEFVLVGSSMKARHSVSGDAHPFARLSTGLLAGWVTDYALDEATLRVLAIEMMPGFLPPEREKRIWLFSFARVENRSEEVVIPALPEGEPIDWKEE